MNKQVEEYLNEIFEDTLENEEWELFLLFSLVYYMAWYFRWKDKENFWFNNIFWEKREVIGFNWITPKWWSYRKTHIHLFFIFQKLWIEVDVDFSKKTIEDFINLLNKQNKKEFKHYETKNDLVNKFINKEETKIFFKEPLFLFLEDKFYEWIEIKNDFNNDKNIKKIFELIDEKISDFVSGEIESKYWVYSFNKQKELLLNKLAQTQNIYWNMFRISEDNFWDKWNEKSFCYLYFFIFLFRNDYISISEIHSVDEIPLLDEEWNYIWENEKYSFMVYLQPKILDLIKWWIELKELILDKIFDEEYKQITIKKKNWELHLLEWDLEIIWDDTKFVELKKQYPFSKIETEIHNWKTSKFIIKEKIKLKKEDK